MGYPADVATVTLNGLFGAALPSVSIPTGYVEIWPNTVLADAGTGEIIEAAKVTAALDGTGAFSVALMATDDTHITPAGWAYWVREVIDGYALRVYQIKVPAAGSPYRLGALQQLSVAATSPYVLQAQVGQPSGVASLDVNGQVPASQLANAAGGGGGTGVPSATVVAETGYGQTTTAGAATTYSRGDHTHGSPALAGTAPTTSATGDAAAVGTGTAPARSDHRHGREAFGTVAAQTTFGAASTDGVATTTSRSDHAHGTPAAPTVPAAATTVTDDTTYGVAKAVGAATTYAREDHNHGSPILTAAAASASAVGDAAAVGTATAPSRADHRHGREAFGAAVAQTTFGAASGDGVATTVSHSDHTHGTPAAPTIPAAATTVTDETTYSVAKVVGTATTYAREDHNHGSPALGATTPAAETIGAAGVVGTGTAPARSDHVHAMPSAATPGTSAVGDAAAAGASASVARADHLHGREAFGAVTAGTSYAAASANGTATTVSHSDHLHGTPPIPFAIAPFGVRGAVAVATGAARFYNDSGRTLTIQSVRSSVGTAPTGASLIVDIKTNGTTIFTTQANRPTIAAAGFTSGLVTNMDITTITNGSYFTVDVAQVGSTVAGSDLTVQITVV